jgi:transposase
MESAHCKALAQAHLEMSHEHRGAIMDALERCKAANHRRNVLVHGVKTGSRATDGALQTIRSRRRRCATPWLHLMRDTPAMLRELNVVEQGYQAVLEVLDDIPVTEVAERFGVTRQTVQRWVARYREGGLAGLADRSHAPKAHPWRVSAEVEAVICDLRTAHRSWGPRRLVFELERRGHPKVSRSTVYRVLVRHHLIEPVSRRRRRDSYAAGNARQRWSCGRWT